MAKNKSKKDAAEDPNSDNAVKTKNEKLSHEERYQKLELRVAELEGDALLLALELGKQFGGKLKKAALGIATKRQGPH